MPNLPPTEKEGVAMVDFEALLKKPPMTEEDRQKLWDDWYNGLPESERKIVDRELKRIGE